MKDAGKAFRIHLLIGNVSHLNHFIRNDQFRNRPTDDLLPLARKKLKAILDDSYIAELFFEKLLEFCVLVFSGRNMPRALEHHSILRYLEETAINSASFGVVSTIRSHPFHRPPSFDASTMVRLVQILISAGH